MFESTCVACGKDFMVPMMNRRWVCCNGRDCGCNGAQLPDEFCSTSCYENYEPAEDDDEPLGGGDVGCEAHIAIHRSDAMRVASKKLKFRSEKAIEETCDFAGMSLADAYKCGAEEAQGEIVNRLAALRTFSVQTSP